MHVSVFDVPEVIKCRCENKFKDKVLTSGRNADGLYDLVFNDVAIHTAPGDGLSIHNRHAIITLDNCDYSIIKIL